MKKFRLLVSTMAVLLLSAVGGKAFAQKDVTSLLGDALAGWSHDNIFTEWNNGGATSPNPGNEAGAEYKGTAWEIWTGNPQSVKAGRPIYKTVNLPAGVYTMKAAVQTAAQNNHDEAKDAAAFFFAGDEEVACFSQTLKYQTVTFVLTEDAEIAYGINFKEDGVANWSAIADITLTQDNVTEVTDEKSIEWVNEQQGCVNNFGKETDEPIFGTDAGPDNGKLSYFDVTGATSIKVYGPAGKQARFFINRAEYGSAYQFYVTIGDDGVGELKIADVLAAQEGAEYVHINGIKAAAWGQKTQVDKIEIVYPAEGPIKDLAIDFTDKFPEDPYKTNSAFVVTCKPTKEKGTELYYSFDGFEEEMGLFEAPFVVAHTGKEDIFICNLTIREYELDEEGLPTDKYVAEGFEQIFCRKEIEPNLFPGNKAAEPIDLNTTQVVNIDELGIEDFSDGYTYFKYTAETDGFFKFFVLPSVKVTFPEDNNYGFKEIEGSMAREISAPKVYGKMVAKGEVVEFKAILGQVYEGYAYDEEGMEIEGETELYDVEAYYFSAEVDDRTFNDNGNNIDNSIQLKAGWQKKSYAVEEIGVDAEGYTWFEYTAEKDGVFTFVATPCDLTTDMLDPLTDMSEVETPDGIRGTAVGKDVKKGDHFYFRVQLPVSYLGFNPYYEVLDENGQPVKDTWYAVDSYLFYAEVIEPFVLGEPGELVLTTTYNEDNSYCSIAAVPTLTKPTTALFYSFDAFEEEMALVEGGKIELAFTPGRADENGVCKFDVTVREYVLDDEGNADFEQLVAEGFEEVSLVAPIEIVIVPGMSENKPLDLGEGWEIVARENIGMDDSNYTYFRLTAQRAGTFVFSCKPGDINPENITLPLLDAEDVTVPGVKAPFFGYEVEAGELITFKAILPAVYFGVDEEDDETYDVVDYNIYTAVIGEDGPTDPDTPVVTPPAVGEEEVCDLTADMFCRWDGFGADAAVVSENAGEYHIGEASGLPYGHGNVEGSAFADLSEYDALKLTVTEGAPRLLLNRQGMDNSGDFIEINDQKGQEYVTVEGDVWTIDIAKIVAEAGYAHLNCIKGANWADVTITEAKLVKYGEPVVGILANGNAEGAYGDVPCAYGKENQGDPHAADIETVDGSKVFVVHATAKVADPWDNQFWICAPIKFYAGDKVRISFRYKADKEATVATQQHCEPGNYNHWAGIGNVTFTTEWQEKTAEFEVTSEVDGNGKGFQSLAFNLNDFADANNYYFDNLVWEIVEGGTGISNVAAPVKAAGIYTLSGTQLNSLQNGINIVIDENGVAKKMILK